MKIGKPQYRKTTIFQVCADIQNDIYHLYAQDSNKKSIYYDVAYISNYKTSVFMNRIFRNIKENECLDTMEESDDEDDFQDMNPAKYVDLKKIVNMEFQFNMKFKRWVPIEITHAPIVNIGLL